MTTIKNALQAALNDLDQIGRDHPEIMDTAVREEMGYATYESFILANPSFQLPEYFAMFTEEGNALIRAALARFLSHPDVIAARLQMPTPAERLAAFQDDSIHSTNGATYEWYFGHTDSLG